MRDPELDGDQAQDERTIVSPKSLYNGKNKLKIKNYDGSVWTNEKGEEWLQAQRRRRVVRQRRSTRSTSVRPCRYSANSAFVQLGMDVGIGPGQGSGHRGRPQLDSAWPGPDVPSFSIGISDPSAIRMAGSYATFAANGKQIDPFSVKTVEYEGPTRSRPRRHRQPKQAFTRRSPTMSPTF